jgi:hypothetical protein
MNGPTASSKLRTGDGRGVVPHPKEARGAGGSRFSGSSLGVPPRGCEAGLVHSKSDAEVLHPRLIAGDQAVWSDGTPESRSVAVARWLSCRAYRRCQRRLVGERSLLQEAEANGGGRSGRGGGLLDTNSGVGMECWRARGDSPGSECRSARQAVSGRRVGVSGELWQAVRRPGQMRAPGQRPGLVGLDEWL